VNWDRGSSIALSLAALAVAVVLVRREFFPSPSSTPLSGNAGFEPTWREALPNGRLVGSPEAPVVIVVISDLECPYCKLFHESLRSIVASYPESVAYSFVHFPLPMHSNALGAARLAECASESGRFAEALDFIFANQDSLGRRDWLWFAERIGMSLDPGARQCLEAADTSEMIRRGVAAGRRMAAVGTPVVYLNGWRYPGAPTDAEFRRAVESLLSGKRPYPEFPSSAIVANARVVARH